MAFTKWLDVMVKMTSRRRYTTHAQIEGEMSERTCFLALPFCSSESVMAGKVPVQWGPCCRMTDENKIIL